MCRPPFDTLAKAQRVDSITWQVRSNSKPYQASVPATNGYAPMDISAIHTKGTSSQEAQLDSVNAMVRWSEFLQQFDYEISYRPGKENVIADALSRRPDHKLTAV